MSGILKNIAHNAKRPGLVFFTMLVLSSGAVAYDPLAISRLFQDNSCRDCDLSGAPLRSRDFSSVDLQRAVITNADLRFVNFSGADLRGANLSGSDLTGANLAGARLDAANLGNVVFCQTTMEDGSLRSDDCIEGIWNEAEGGVMEILRQDKNLFVGIQLRGIEEWNGTSVLQNIKRTAPGVYIAKLAVGIEDEIYLIDTTCTVSGPQMVCLGDMFSFTLGQATLERPEQVKLRRGFEYNPSENIGAPTNREGTGSR